VRSHITRLVGRVLQTRMVPAALRFTSHSTPRLLLTLLSLAPNHVLSYFHSNDPFYRTLAKRREGFKHDTKHILFACLIPVLVLLSGMFAGLTLGYMSLDETQLNVLSISGTPSVASSFHLSSLLKRHSVSNVSTRTRLNLFARMVICSSSPSSLPT
jgi:hypothetical protein